MTLRGKNQGVGLDVRCTVLAYVNDESMEVDTQSAHFFPFLSIRVM